MRTSRLGPSEARKLSTCCRRSPSEMEVLGEPMEQKRLSLTGVIMSNVGSDADVAVGPSPGVALAVNTSMQRLLLLLTEAEERPYGSFLVLITPSSTGIVTPLVARAVMRSTRLVNAAAPFPE